MARAVAGSSGSAAEPTWIVGCGEILPQVVARWVPRSHALWCVDLSKHSLIRAQIRLAKTLRRANCLHSSLEEALATHILPDFGHIDAYGVLHHTAEPLGNLHALAAKLLPGGTMRLMVYNSKGREFLHNLQAAFRILELSPFVRADVMFAKELLLLWGKDCPHMSMRLEQLGKGTLNNRARFVDTFMHPRECRLSLTDWWTTIHNAGLEIHGLFDRYGELDDLAPSLWQAPTLRQLEERVDDLRFENNFEFYLCKPGSAVRPGKGHKPYLAGPPRTWFSFEETKGISWNAKWTLWHEYVNALAGEPQPLSLNLPMRALRRLYRLGAILPNQLSAIRRAGAAKPMQDFMEPPSYPEAKTIQDTRVPTWIRSQRVNLDSAKQEQALRRLRRASSFGKP